MVCSRLQQQQQWVAYNLVNPLFYRAKPLLLSVLAAVQTVVCPLCQLFLSRAKIPPAASGTNATSRRVHCCCCTNKPRGGTPYNPGIIVHRRSTSYLLRRYMDNNKSRRCLLLFTGALRPGLLSVQPRSTTISTAASYDVIRLLLLC